MNDININNGPGFEVKKEIVEKHHLIFSKTGEEVESLDDFFKINKENGIVNPKVYLPMALDFPDIFKGDMDNIAKKYGYKPLPMLDSCVQFIKVARQGNSGF